MGKGAYGVVWKAQCRKTNKIVAIKKVFDAFQNKIDSQRTFREVMYLSHLKGHPLIVNLKNVIKSKNRNDLYLVFEFMETDLSNVIMSGKLNK